MKDITFDQLVAAQDPLIKKKALKEGLARCTEKQKQVFSKMYVSVDAMDDSNLDWAITQVQRTIKNNENEDQ